ncbi:MAG: LysM peptidoglycan-binding protein [Bacteroidota bacterium]|nr:LysM peptidoglycan-binding protein [Bacteroidota bacterium]
MQREFKILVMKRIFFSVLLVACLAVTLDAKSHSETKHVVKKGETLYSISKNYGVKPGDLVKANPHISKNLKVGQQVVIPHKASVIQASTARPKTVSIPSTPDTPYREEDNRKSSNAVNAELPTATINNDQPVLKKTVERVYEPAVAEAPIKAATTATDYPGVFSQYPAHGYKAKKDRGAANYLSDNTSGNPYLALYNGVESGTVIRVTNMMNKKSVFVKVVGKVPPVDVSKEVILKLSKKAASDLGAIDEKFLVEVVGYSAN